MIFRSIAFILITVWIETNQAQICPPPCDPPMDITGCFAFTTDDTCNEETGDPGIDLTECGCLWKTYIENLADPERYAIFTQEGIQCFVWAMTVCEVEDYKTTPKPITKIVDIQTGEVFGKVDTVKGKYKTVDRIEKVVVQEKPDSKDHRGKFKIVEHWYFYWGMNDEKFKLSVFGFILLFNGICVAIAVCCRCDNKKREKMVRLSGDLDPDTYVKKLVVEKSDRTLGIEKFLDKLRKYKDMKLGKKENSYGILQMDNVGPVFQSQPVYKQDPYQGLFHSGFEPSDELDTTYEEPMPAKREIYHSQLRREESFSDDENILYENVRPKEQSRSVSFKLTPGEAQDQTIRGGSTEKR